MITSVPSGYPHELGNPGGAGTPGGNRLESFAPPHDLFGSLFGLLGS